MTKRSWLARCRQHVDEATELVLSLDRLVRSLTRLTFSSKGFVVALALLAGVVTLALR